MQSDLPPSQQLNMQRKANDLKLERELKHAQIKLQETQEQCATAVEIIGTLQKENEDLLSAGERLRAEQDAAETEIKILEHKVKSLQDVYRSDTRKLEEEVDSTKQQLVDLTEDITQRDMALNEAKQHQQTLQNRLNDHEDINNDGTKKKEKHMSKKEREILQKLQKEQKKVLDRDHKIERLLSQLEGATRLQHENESLQNEIESFGELAQQDLMMQKYQIEKMTQEIIALGSSNSQLAQEKEAMQAMLEKRDYENQMLKTGYGLHRTKTHANMDDVVAQLDDADSNQAADEFDDDINVEYADQQPMTLADLEQYSGYTDNDRDSLSGSPTHKKPEKKVADVTREYLHLTASVVNMKFPKIPYASEELINQVKNYQFWEYHDMMVRIMKIEEKKMLEKQKAQNAAKANTGSGGMLGRLGKFRNFFGKTQQANGASNAAAANPRNNRKSMLAPSTTLKGIKTRSRNKSENSRTIEKKAPSAPSMQDAKKKMVALKEATRKKITGNPTEKDTEHLAKMSFEDVPFVGFDDNNTPNKKPSKPDQGL